MNLTIGENKSESKNNSSNRRLAARVIATAVSATLGLSAIAGFSGQLTNSRAATTPRTSYAPVTTSIATRAESVRVVLVATEEQQQRLESALAQDQFLVQDSGQPASTPPMVVVKGSALEQSLTAASGDVAGSGTSVQVTDTTVPVTAVTLTR